MRGICVREGRLQLVDDLVRPTPGPGQVEVRISHASVNPTDLELAAGVYDAMLSRHGSLALPRTGLEFSGVVTTPGVELEVGAAVFGYVDLLKGEKTHQERIVIGEGLVARKPPSLSFEQAAALPLGAQTSLVALRDVARAQPGERVLIHGASGGLGVYAVQIASRMLETHVTAVAGGPQSKLLTRLGAHEFVDYRATDIVKSGLSFDVIFDLTTKLQFHEIEPLLSPEGRFMPAEPLKAGVDFTPGARSGERSVNLWVERGDGALLTQIADWASQGALEVFVDSVYPLDAFEEAFARINQPNKRGRVVLSLNEGTP